MYGEFDENRPGVIFPLFVIISIVLIVFLWACNQEEESPSEKARKEFKRLEKELRDERMERDR